MHDFILVLYTGLVVFPSEFFSWLIILSDCLGRRLGPRFLGGGGDDSAVIIFLSLSISRTSIMSEWI